MCIYVWNVVICGCIKVYEVENILIVCIRKGDVSWINFVNIGKSNIRYR